MKKLIETRQALFPEEWEMPLAKYYHNYPFYDLPEDVKAKIYGPPMDFREAILPEKFIDWLLPVGEYTNHENGYCMLPDGTGYICTYMQIPETVEPRKIFWYLKWLNTHSRSMVLGHGNLRYKIWNPADHFDHYFVNWVDADDGVFTTESLDIGQGERQYNTIRHSFNLRDYGLTDEKIAALNSDNYKVKETSDWESFDFPGAHLTLGQIRPLKEGGWERRSVEWIGWRPSQGKLIREERTPCNEAYLRKVANHIMPRNAIKPAFHYSKSGLSALLCFFVQ